MKNIFNKLLAVTLVIVMLLSMVCINAYAYESENPIYEITAEMTRPLYEGFDGEWEIADDGSKWFRYDEEIIKDLVIFTVYYMDGKVVKGKWRDVYTNELSWAGIDPFGFFSGNSEYDPWFVGHSFEVDCNWHNPDRWFDSPFTVTIAESPVASVTAKATKPLTENAAGKVVMDYDLWESYYEYNPRYSEPELTVKFKDSSKADVVGTLSEVEDLLDVEVKFESPEQNYYNQWKTGGTYKALANVFGTTGEFDVTVTSSDIADVSIKATRKAYLNADNYQKDSIFDDDYNVIGEFSYYPIEVFEPVITVTYENGFSVSAEPYDCRDKFFANTYFKSEQNAKLQWDSTGTYKYQAEVYLEKTETSYDVEFDVEIIPNPIVSMSVVSTSPISMNEYECYDEEGYWVPDGEGIKIYSGTGRPEVTLTLTDGTVKTYMADDLYQAFGERYGSSYSDNQSYTGPEWQVGTHTKTLNFMGHSADYSVYLVDKYATAIRVVSTPKLKFESNGWHNEFGNYTYEYSEAEFVIELDCYDGVKRQYTVSRMNNQIDGMGSVTINDNQYENPWTLENGGEVNISFNDMYENSISTTAKIQIIEPNYDYEYYVRNNKAIITSYKKQPEATIVIPDNIDGYEVGGIEDFYDYTSEMAVGVVKKIVLPDTLTMLSDYAFGACENLEEIVIGSSLTDISEEAFFAYSNLKTITVSKDNKNYCSQDGVLYTKDMSKLVACPLNYGKTVNVKNGDVDISVFETYYLYYASIKFVVSENGSLYKTVDGVTYNSDMTKVICCSLEKSGTYTMPETVTEIGTNAFFGCNKLSTVKISNKVTDIAYAAFANCTALANVTLPSALVSIDESAFESTTALKSISFPNKLEIIGVSAFNSSGLQSVTIPDSTKELCYKAFENTPITSLNLGNGVETIDTSFKNCDKLTTVKLPKSLKSFAGAFCGCDLLANVTIENGIKSISYSAFGECISLKTITIPSSVTTIEQDAFSYAGLEKIVIPDTVTALENGAFSYCSKLADITIGLGIEKINDFVFEGCKATNIVWGKNVVTLGNFSFRNMGAESVEIPNTVTKIMYGAFENSENLSNIKIPTSVTEISAHVFDYTKWYKAQPNGSTYIGDVFYRFKGDTYSPTSVTVKNGTRLIADTAFEHSNESGDWWPEIIDRYYDLSGINKITLPDSVEYIGNLVFHNLENITTLRLPASLKQIGYFNFENCSGLKTLDIGAATADITALTFAGLYNITDVLVDEKNTKYKSVDGVLYNKQLTELIYCPAGKTGNITIPATVKKVNEYAFTNNCLESITVLAEDISFDYNAFKDYYYDWDNDYIEPFYVYPGYMSYYVDLKGIKGSSVETYANENHVGFEAISTLKDNGSNVSVIGNSSDAIPEGAVISVELSASDSNTYDITLEKNGVKVQPNGPVTVVLPLPDGMPTNCKVYRIEDDGSKTDMHATVADGKIFFTTDHFSIYVIEVAAYTPGDINDDGDVALTDVVALAQYIAEWDGLSINEAALDVNGDGDVTLTDVVHLAQYLAEWDGIVLN